MTLTAAILTTDKREHEKDYLNPLPSFGTAPEALLQGLAKYPDIRIHVISCLQEPVRSPEKLAENIWYHGLHVPKLGWMRTGYQGCVRAVRRKLREIKPDIVHGQGTERDCAISAVLSGYPNVVTIHGNMAAMARFYRAGFGSYHWAATKLENYALDRTFGVFCNSAYTERLVAPRARRVWRVPNAVRSAFFNIVQQQQPAPEKPVLLNVGVVSTHKRQIEVLRIARRLWSRGCRFEMLFIGAMDSTEYAAAFREELRHGEAAGYARHVGFLSVEKLIAAYDTASAMVHFPSEESFGLVVAEGLARNLKFFGAGIGGVPDIAGNVDGAELFADHDWAALENAIARWMAEGFQKPHRASDVMQTRYHPGVIARQHLEIYREVLSSPS
jgi:glycosyltransferase involved in cell wall biosynthesis